MRAKHAIGQIAKIRDVVVKLKGYLEDGAAIKLKLSCAISFLDEAEELAKAAAWDEREALEPDTDIAKIFHNALVEVEHGEGPVANVREAGD